MFKIRIPPGSMYREFKILEDFTTGNSRKSQIEPYEWLKMHFNRDDCITR